MFLENVAEAHDRGSITISQSSCCYPSFSWSACIGTFFSDSTFYPVSPSLFFLPFQSLVSWFFLNKCTLSILQVQMILSGDTALILAQIAINMVLRKLFFFFWLLTFSYPHSSDGLLVLEHNGKIHMAPGGVLNLIPMVGWVTYRLDRPPNSKSLQHFLNFRINFMTWSSLRPQGHNYLSSLIFLKLLGNTSLRASLNLLHLMCDRQRWLSYCRSSAGDNGHLLAHSLVGVKVIALVCAVLLHDDPGCLLRCLGMNSAHLDGSLVKEPEKTLVVYPKWFSCEFNSTRDT